MRVCVCACVCVCVCVHARVHESTCIYVCNTCMFRLSDVLHIWSISYKMLLNDEEIKAKTALWMTENGEYLKEMEGTYTYVCLYMYTSMD